MTMFSKNRFMTVLTLQDKVKNVVSLSVFNLNSDTLRNKWRNLTPHCTRLGNKSYIFKKRFPYENFSKILLGPTP